ncbi:MAG: isochorismatase [Armatimonadota bacterium]
MFTRYEPRPLAFLGVEEVAGYRLKRYGIRWGEAPLEWARFEDGWRQAIAVLPQPAVTEARPGVGFAILHQGRTGDYLVLGWWDHENDLPVRVFVRDAEGWRPAAGESFCVWDLRVLWWEREAYVATLLSGRRNSLDDYLRMTLDGDA